MDQSSRIKHTQPIQKSQVFPLFVLRLWRKLVESVGSALYLAALLLVGASVWAACAKALQSGWNAEAAAWVQAGGSIAAIVGATWLAQSEARRARKVRREHQEEAAWYVRFAVVQAQFESQIIAAELVNRTSEIESDDVRGWRQRATTVAVGLNALVSRTDHVHPAVTHVLSNAKVLIDDLVCDLALLAKAVSKERSPKQDLIGKIVSPHRALLELIEVYDSRMRGVRIALDEGNDALPIRTWASWSTTRPTSVPQRGDA